MVDEADLLEAMVAIPSPSGHEAPLVSYLLGVLPRFGYRTSVDTVGNLIASRGTGVPHVMYLGHVDTVPGEIPVLRSGQHLQGRGSVDAKGPLAAALVGGSSIPEDGGTFTVVGAVGEEADSRGAMHLLRSGPPDYLMVGEPGGWERITLGYRGLIRLRYSVEVEPAHGSAPAPSAGDLVVDFAAKAGSCVRSFGGPRPPAAKVVRLWSGDGHQATGAAVELEVRMPLGIDGPGIMAALEPLANGGKLEVLATVPPVAVPRENAVVRALSSAIRALGGRPHHVQKGGTSDMNLAAARWAIPMATYGPGDSHLDHTPREAMDLEDLTRARLVLEAAFRRLLRSP